MILTLIIFAIGNVILAFVDSRLIGKGRKILHWVNGLVYAAMLAVPYFIFHNLWLIGALVFERLIVFSIMLSLFRGLAWDYITPENPPKAFTDRIQKLIFGMNGLVQYVIYALLFITFLFIIFL